MSYLCNNYCRLFFCRRVTSLSSVSASAISLLQFLSIKIIGHGQGPHVAYRGNHDKVQISTCCGKARFEAVCASKLPARFICLRQLLEAQKWVNTQANLIHDKGVQIVTMIYDAKIVYRTCCRYLRSNTKVDWLHTKTVTYWLYNTSKCFGMCG